MYGGYNDNTVFIVKQLFRILFLKTCTRFIVKQT